MQLQPGRGVPAVLKQVDKGIRMKGWFPAGEAQALSRRWQEADGLLCSVEQPGVISVLGWLRAHQAVVVALLGQQEAVVRGGLLPEDGDPAAIRRDADDVARFQVAQIDR